jgi:arylsulfatase A-like enzyme
MTQASRLFIAGILVALSFHHGALAAAPPVKPNILFLFADDMREDSIAALGNPDVKTPNIDTLVQRGFALRNAYCLGGNSPAVCTPSRNMLLSGNVYFRWRDYVSPMSGKKQVGLLSPGAAPNFPLSMQDAGYVTYHHGKRGNTALEIQAKFQTNKYLKNDEGDRMDGEPGKEIIDEAIPFVTGGHEGKPFFMYLAFGNPHDPRVAAPKYLDQYDEAKLPLQKNYLPVHPFNNGEMTIRDEKLLPWPRTPEAIRKTLHEYYATITGLDFHIGRLLDALKTSGQLDNTIIIFSADQGIGVGSHGLLGKQSLYDSAMKCPLVFAGPGIRHGQSDALVYLHDIYPTVCQLAGAPAPQGIDGRSFLPVLNGQSRKARDELFLSYMSVQRALRDDRWKLIRYPQVNVTQLFDLQADPDETRDLSADTDQVPRVAQMLVRLKAAQEKAGDTLPLTVPNPQPASWTPPVDVPQENAQ